MSDLDFESILSGQLRQYAQAGVRPIDRYAIAEATIAGGRTSSGWRWSPGFGHRTLVPILVGLLLAALLGGAAIVGIRLLVPAPVVPIPHSYVDEFVPAPDLSRAMAWPRVAPLLDGRVLIIGAGSEEDLTPTALLYDPATGVSTPVGPMVDPFVGSAVRLLDGRVLIVGDGAPQIFDPTTMRFAPVGAMVDPRVAAAVALLHDGRVLLAGGSGVGGGPHLSSAELFDPDTLTFSPTGPMGTPGYGGPMATLPDGRVFAAPIPMASVSGPTAEVYDPRTGTFSAAGTFPELGGGGTFGVNGAIVIPDGRVVVVGSAGVQQSGRTAIWDPTSRTFSPSRSAPGPVLSATLLDDGRILLTGGSLTGSGDLRWAGIYDPTTGVTVSIKPPAAVLPSTTRLADGRVLFVGGLASGEIHQDPVSGAYMLAPAVPTVEIFQ
jgi:hypothetical protein